MTVSAWILAARPKTLTAAAAPVLLGTAVASEFAAIRKGPCLAVFLGALFLQIGSNFANDVFDFEKGADTNERLGPVRAVQAGLLTPSAMKKGLWVVLTLALLIGGYLTAIAGPVVLAIGLSSMLCAVAYTGGPYPLGYHGLGDLLVFLFFGPVAVCGTVFVHLGHVPELAVLYSVPLGLLSTNILIVNNLRDQATDRKAGKRTLVVRFGAQFGRWHYLVGLLLAYVLVAWPALRQKAGPWSLLPLFTALPAARIARGVWQAEGATLNPLLARSAQLVFLFGAAAALGLWLDGRGT
jgi:1,4-dihydroxy-2-naphthoate polyprenyltransferase